MAKRQRYQRGTKTVYARPDYREDQSEGEAVAESAEEIGLTEAFERLLSIEPTARVPLPHSQAYYGVHPDEKP